MNESVDQNAASVVTEPRRWSLLDHLAISLGTGMGIGFAPKAPGTFGSLLGPPLVIAVQQLELSLPVLVLLIAVFIALGVPVCARASQALGKHDPGQVVYDEIAAFWLVFLPHLLTGTAITWQLAVAGFLLFRVFDILKPWPVSRLERLPGGVGIMADDLAAGLMAAACLLIVTS